MNLNDDWMDNPDRIDVDRELWLKNRSDCKWLPVYRWVASLGFLLGMMGCICVHKLSDELLSTRQSLDTACQVISKQQKRWATYGRVAYYGDTGTTVSGVSGITFDGSTSGSVTLAVPSVAGPVAGQVLTTDSSGSVSWQTIPVLQVKDPGVSK